MAIAVLGVGVATALTAMTKINGIASAARNSTGAQSVAQNEIDKFLSYGPFNPQKTNSDGSIQVPIDNANNPRTYDLTLGTHVYTNIPIYQDPATGTVVSGTLTDTITDISTTPYGYKIWTYQATVRITYSYLNRNYTLTMNAVRVSDI
ncbi:MAG: hypothetical protein M3R59_02090 [Verrucomicrobiota bacterium]|nr:hypothetical protein [Verrucomicrobiota bacterium]